jgi:hypothetical protein
MKLQNQIKRALSQPEAIEYVRRLLEEEEEFITLETAAKLFRELRSS